jgi:hypothetical protein
MEPQGTPPEAPNLPQQTPQTPPRPEQDEEFASAGRSTADYINSLEPVKRQQKKRRINRIILLIIPVILALGAGGYFLFAKPKKAETPQSATTGQAQQAPVEKADDNLSEHYVSQSLRFTVDYPKSWTKNDETTGQLTLQSPKSKLTDTSGTKTDGQVTITIVGTGKPVPNFTGAMAAAAAESVKIAYKQPAATQRKETYLSFLNFGTSQGIGAAYITGDFGYQKGQDIPKTDIAKIDPIISVSFAGSDNKPLAISPEAWSSDEILKVTQSVLQSLVFQ